MTAKHLLVTCWAVCERVSETHRTSAFLFLFLSLRTVVNSTASLHFGKAVHRREPVCVFAEDGAPAENCAPQPASTFERVCPSSPRLGLRAPAASAYNHGRPDGEARPHNTDECGDIAAGGQERSGRCGDDAYFLHMLDSRPSSCIDLSGSWMQYAPSSTRGESRRDGVYMRSVFRDAELTPAAAALVQETCQRLGSNFLSSPEVTSESTAPGRTPLHLAGFVALKTRAAWLPTSLSLHLLSHGICVWPRSQYMTAAACQSNPLR